MLLLYILVASFCVPVLPQSYWSSYPLRPWSYTTSGALYGTHVAVGSKTVLVASPKENVFSQTRGTQTNAGAVHAFRTNDPTWSMQQRITASDGEAGDEFGSAISISPTDGLYLLVGAKYNLITDAGCAYVFWRATNEDDFQELTKLSLVDGIVGDLFGAEVAISDTHAVVAAPGKVSNSGKVYVYLRGGGSGASATFTLTATLTSGTAASNNYFGASVSIFKNVIAVGVPGGDLITPSRENGGFVDMFVLDTVTTLWERSATPLITSAGKAFDYTGSDVAVGQGTVLISAPMDDHTELVDVGSVHAYTYNYECTFLNLFVDSTCKHQIFY